MAQEGLIRVGQTADNAKPFVYEQSSKMLCRFFQLNYDEGYGEPGDPLAGRLLTTHFVGDSREAFKYWLGNWQNFLDLARSDTPRIMEALSGSSKFSALSYSWGKDRERYPLYVSTIASYCDNDPKKFYGDYIIQDHEPERNGYLWITPSLHSYLQEMRRQRFRRFVWIDALCINQGDDNDKNDQLPRMKDIYEEAEDVYVWLGDGTRAEHSMMKIMPFATAKLRTTTGPKGMDLRDWFALQRLPAPDDDIWKACAGLFTRDWWSRLWTLQEVVVATGKGQKHDRVVNVHMLCGPASAPWSAFSEFAEALAKNHLKQWLITGHDGVRPDHYHGLDAIVEVRTCRQARDAHEWSVTLGALLVATRRRQATVPADTVIGMQALLDYVTIRELALNVSMPTEEVFVRFGKHYIRNEVRECILNHTATQHRLPGLPSWCPNFASPEETIPIGTRWLGHFHEKASHRAQMPCAGFQKKGPWRLPRNRWYYARWAKNAVTGRDPWRGQYDTPDPRQITTMPLANHIIASGLELDTVTSLVPPNSGAGAANFLSHAACLQTLDWDVRCFGLAKRTLRGVRSSRAAYDLYARTLACNRVALLPNEPLDSSTTPPLPPRPVVYDDDASSFTTTSSTAADEASDEEDSEPRKSELFTDRHEVHDFATPYLAFREFLGWTREAGTGLGEEVLDPGARNYARCMGPMSRGRSFFATAGGKIGMGPADARPGDRLVVFFFCPTPYLIRPVDGEGRRWRFVGEAYVRGLMYGEALGMFEMREVEERKWVIE